MIILKTPTNPSIPKVTIIILHLKNRENLIECLDSIHKLFYSNFDIVVIANGTTYPLPPYLKSISSPHLDVLCISDNVGYSRGNNYGIRKALKNGADYILLLNDDTIADPYFLDTLVEVGERRPESGTLGPKIYYYDDPQRIWFAGARFNYRSCSIAYPGADKLDDGDFVVPLFPDFITGCALMIKRETIEKIGLMNENFFLYWEDVDWGLRAKRAGLYNRIVPEAKVWHKVSASGGGNFSPLKAYHKTRSHLQFAKLHTPWVIAELHKQFFRDIAWLLVKSSDRNRYKRAFAFISAIVDYHLARTGKGPGWIW